jgi:hypothetical protein
MTGRPLTAVLDGAFLRAHPPASVPSLTDEAWRAGRREAPLVEDRERYRQLEQLGYVGDED